MRNPRDIFICLFSFIKMGFRTVYLEKCTRLNLDLNNIVVNYEHDKYYICLDEIDTIIVEDPRCNISLILLSEICKKGISIIFTDTSHMPVGCLTTFNNHSRTAKNLVKQIDWQQEIKQILWTKIIESKIKNQVKTLEMTNNLDKINILNEYINTIQLGDITNREGSSSRIYFKELFGSNFKRFNEDIINYCLNYTYQIIRSKLSQEIVSLGYNPSLGINHKSEYNYFNLADDYIEPYRPIVDLYVYNILLHSEEDFLTCSIKRELVNILNYKVIYDGVEQKIKNSIILYLQNMFSFIETGDYSRIKFPIHLWNINT